MMIQNLNSFNIVDTIRRMTGEPEISGGSVRQIPVSAFVVDDPYLIFLKQISFKIRKFQNFDASS